jgi:hypothetical protein
VGNFTRSLDASFFAPIDATDSTNNFNGSSRQQERIVKDNYNPTTTTTFSSIPPENESLLRESMATLLANLVSRKCSVKVRWNAAYAIGNTFRNPHIRIEEYEWGKGTLESLIAVGLTDSNFKVGLVQCSYFVFCSFFLFSNYSY